MALDGVGAIYIAAPGNFRIRRETPDGIISTYAAAGPSAAAVAEGSPAPLTAMTPNCLAFDAQGNLLYCDIRSNRLRRIDKSSLAVTTVAGDGQAFPGFNAPPSPAVSTGFNGYARSIAVDGGGNIYFTDLDELKKVDTAGMLSVVESPTAGTSSAIAVAPDGSLVVGGNGPILQRVQPNGTVLTL
ncbi:MAG: hypothetical protein M3Y07_15085 [Acidobacteriota bacterium]|nr:hypothetical protein [Acidobacteriota bacterium]